jgi:hypothetical protein
VTQEGLTKYRLSRRNALLASMLRPQSRPYLPGTNAPCVLASERPSRPGDERYSAKPFYLTTIGRLEVIVSSQTMRKRVPTLDQTTRL